MKVRIHLNGRNIDIPGVQHCKNKAIGLMFSSREKAPNLLFEFSRPGTPAIHSLFVTYPFVAIWIHEKIVVDVRIIRPFTLSARPPSVFTHLVEIPINQRNKDLVKNIVGEEDLLESDNNIEIKTSSENRKI